MDLGAVRAAIKARLDAAAIADLEVVSGWPDVVQPRGGGCVAIVRVVGAQYGQTFGADRSVVDAEIHLFVSLAGGLQNAEARIEPYLSNTGSQSILQAIRGDPYLSSSVQYALPPEAFREYDVKQVGKMQLLGAVIDLEVHVS